MAKLIIRTVAMKSVIKQIYTCNFLLAANAILLFASLNISYAAQERSANIFHSDSLYAKLQQRIDSLQTERKTMMSNQLSKDIEFARDHINRANRIIDWSAMFFTVFAILIVIAGALGMREFSNIRHTEQNMKQTLSEMKSELQQIQTDRADLDAKTNRFMEITYHYNEGISAYYKGEYLSARESFYRVLDLEPHHPRAYYLIGRSLTLENKNEEADAIFNKILTIDPKYSSVYVGLAMNCSEDQQEQALSYCKKAIDLDSENTFALYYLGIIYRDLNKLEESFRYFLKAHKIKKFARTSFYLGVIYWLKGELENSEKYFNETIYLAQDQIERVQNIHWPLYWKGVIEGLRGNLKKSKLYFDQSLSYNNVPVSRQYMKSDLVFLLSHKKDDERIKTMISYLGEDE